VHKAKQINVLHMEVVRDVMNLIAQQVPEKNLINVSHMEVVKDVMY
jgi:hypothetical protein